jgi:hypothetical protein
MAGETKTKTFAQTLSDMAGLIGVMTTSQGADVDFCMKLQMLVAAKAQQMAQQAFPMPKSPGGQGSPLGQPGMPAGAAGGGPAGATLAGPPGVNGVNQLAAPPNPDELQRMLAGGAGQ